MSTESPESHKEVSEAEWNNLKQEALQYRALIKSHPTASRSYSHVMLNLAFAFHPDLIDRAMHENRSSEYQGIEEGITYAKRYFQLLEDFPKFAEGELNSGNGYFPDLYNQLHRAEDFIDEYERRLRAK